MPDIRTLLDDVTTRVPSPDPVAAVHATVRQRARIRTAFVTSAAIAAVLTVLAATALGSGIRHAEPATQPWSWRDYASESDPVPTNDPAFDRAARLVHAHRDVFVGLEWPFEHHYDFRFVFSADADPAEWTDEIEAAVGDRNWFTTKCDETARELDRIAAEARKDPWPSGTHVREIEYFAPCSVFVVLDRITAEDRAYARDRWSWTVMPLAPAAPRTGLPTPPTGTP